MSTTLRRREGYLFLALFIACIPAANYLIHHVGTVCVPKGPCLIPLGFGVMSPSGVLMIGVALVLRDLVQRRLGVGASLAAVLAGAGLSAFLAPPALVLASGAAFLLSELADMLVFTPLQRKGLVKAAFVSSLVGLVVDSVLFLSLAFGSLAHLEGQILGKLIMVLLALPLLALVRARDARLGLHPA